MNRRQLLLSSTACGLGLARSDAARARTAGRVCYGFSDGSLLVTVIPTLLRGLQALYQPDLGAALALFPGNAGARALDAVRSGAADGSNVLLSPSGPMTLLPHLRKLPGVDPVSDFIAVAPLLDFASFFVVGAAVPAEVTTMAVYFDWLRASPQHAAYGLAALGIPPHLTGMAMSRQAGVEVKGIGYQGTGPMMKDVASGALPAAFVSTAPSAEQRQAGIRMLGVCSATRWPGLPDVPTLLESGISDVVCEESLGLYVRAGTPAAKVHELNAAVQEVQRSAAVAAVLARTRQRALSLSAEDYAATLAAEREAWKAVVQRERYSLQG